MEKYFEKLIKIEQEECETGGLTKVRGSFRHLVLSGGSIWGLKIYGALRYAFSNGFLQKDLLKSIYATSVGSMIATIILIGIDFTVLDKYLIDRPWHKTWSVTPMHLLSITDTWGIYTKTFMDEFFIPIFKSKDISLDITFAEFYVLTGIDYHIFATELNSFKYVDFSHKTHPTWKVMDAVYASCCVPVVFSPFQYGDRGECYIDGGIHMNYPLKPCVEKIGKENSHEILGILLPLSACKDVMTDHHSDDILTGNANTDNASEGLPKEKTFFDYISQLLNRLLESRLFINDLSYRIPYQLELQSIAFSIEYMQSVLNHPEERRKLIEEGSSQMQIWIDRQ